MASRYTTIKEWTRQANSVHKNKYDYSKTYYVYNKMKIDIICKEHGEFTIIAGNHLKGQGCPKCDKRNTRNIEEQFMKMRISPKKECPVISKGFSNDFSLLEGHSCEQCATLHEPIKFNVSYEDELMKSMRETFGEIYEFTHESYSSCERRVVPYSPIFNL